MLRHIETQQMKEVEKRVTFGRGVVNSLKRYSMIRILGPFVALCIFYAVIAVEFGAIAFFGSLPSLLIVWLGSKHVDVSKVIMH